MLTFSTRAWCLWCSPPRREKAWKSGSSEMKASRPYRWPLLAQDCVNSALLRITHDFLAMMLGTDRPSVSLAASGLQKRRIIEYSRGSVRILNRKKLESSACECYGIIQQFSGGLALR